MSSALYEPLFLFHLVFLSGGRFRRGTGQLSISFMLSDTYGPCLIRRLLATFFHSSLYRHNIR